MKPRRRVANHAERFHRQAASHGSSTRKEEPMYEIADAENRNTRWAAAIDETDSCGSRISGYGSRLRGNSLITSCH
jgi:hypothetical protein